MSDLPEKLYYSISEVADHTGVKAHVLRYWEQEFPTLRPKKNRAGNRSYRMRDIEEVLTIKRLLYEDGFTIGGARQKLTGEQLELLGLPPEAQRQKKVASLKRDVADLLEFVRRL